MKKVIFISIFILAVFIRLYHIGYFASYGTETAQHYLEIIKLLHGNLLLNGPPTSHPWLRLGSMPYYLFFPIFYLTRYHPLTLFYFWVIIDIGTLFLNYYVVRKVFNGKTALLATLFLSFSPLALTFNRVSGFYNFVIPLTYLLLLSIYRILHKKNSSYWPIFLIVGLMINLHASSLILVPFFIGLGIYLKKFSRSGIIASIGAFFIPNIPFFIKDYSSGFNMTRNLLLWIPYKIFNFFSGKTLGVNRVLVKDETVSNILNFFKTMIFPPQYPLVFGVIIAGLLLLFLLVKKHSFFIRILYFWLIFGIISLLIHKNPPIHYFVPLLILPIILISYIVTNMNIAIILFITISNLLFIFSAQYLFLDRSKNPFDVQYKTQEKITKSIIQNAKGRQFSLSRVGPFDNYPGQSKENYGYLLWWMGNRPVRNAQLKYTIVEKKNGVTFSSSLHDP